jgi:perosamine synthetase
MWGGIFPGRKRMDSIEKVPMFRPFMSGQAIFNAIDVLRSGWIGEGPLAQKFEGALTELFSYRYPIATNTGTAAIHLALDLAGVERGDEVITTPMTCTATNHPILQMGAKPVFTDIQHGTGNMDPQSIRKQVSEKTKAILVVYWGGLPADMNEITAIAHEYDVPIIADGAQALGATYFHDPIDTWADFTIISFQAIKIITSVDGGVLLCPNKAVADTARLKRWYGIDRVNRKPTPDGYYDWHVGMPGYKYHMNDLAASIGLGNLKHIRELFYHNQLIAALYREELKDVDGITLFDTFDDRMGTNWLFTIHVQDRENFIRALLSRGVESSIVHRRNDLEPVFGGKRLPLPVLNEYEKTYVSIPIGHHITQEVAHRVVGAIKGGW